MLETFLIRSFLIPCFAFLAFGIVDQETQPASIPALETHPQTFNIHYSEPVYPRFNGSLYGIQCAR